jgi:hypothetical protein
MRNDLPDTAGRMMERKPVAQKIDKIIVEYNMMSLSFTHL